jgi:hypothetical protein
MVGMRCFVYRLVGSGILWMSRLDVGGDLLFLCFLAQFGAIYSLVAL